MRIFGMLLLALSLTLFACGDDDDPAVDASMDAQVEASVADMGMDMGLSDVSPDAEMEDAEPVTVDTSTGE